MNSAYTIYIQNIHCVVIRENPIGFNIFGTYFGDTVDLVSVAISSPDLTFCWTVYLVLTTEHRHDIADSLHTIPSSEYDFDFCSVIAQCPRDLSVPNREPVLQDYFTPI